MGMGIDDTIRELEWKGMGITLYVNGNGPYSHGNKFPSADAVFIAYVIAICRYDSCVSDE